MWRKIKFYTVSAIILALGGTCLYLYYFGGRRVVVHRLVDAPGGSLREIQPLSELVTVKYSIQKVIGLKEEKVPFGSEQVLLMVQADVLGGVDLGALNTNDVQVVNDNVTMKLPPPKVMHVYLDEKQTRVWDRSKTWWTPWEPFDPELEQKARLAALEAVQAAALQMGILSNAQENAQTTIRTLLRAVGVESVRFITAEDGHAVAP